MYCNFEGGRNWMINKGFVSSWVGVLVLCKFDDYVYIYLFWLFCGGCEVGDIFFRILEVGLF